MKLYTPHPAQIKPSELIPCIPELLNPNNTEFNTFLEQSNNPDYINYTTFKTRYEDESNIEHAWKWVRANRMMRSTNTPINHPNGNPFKLIIDTKLQSECYTFDRINSPLLDQIESNFNILKDTAMILESCASCELAGFKVDEHRAKIIIWGGASAKTKAEKLVQSYHRILTQLDGFNYELSLESFKSIHHQLLSPILKEKASRIRTDDTPCMWTNAANTLFYGLPPQPNQAISEINSCCKALHHDTSDGYHPLIRAAILLFSIMVNRPFRDHNTLTGRLWVYILLNQSDYADPIGISLSTWILNHTEQWDDAFANTLFDGNDLTYFVRTFLTAINSSCTTLLNQYETRKSQTRSLSKEKQTEYQLNKRQTQTLLQLLDSKNEHISPTMYMNQHRVSWATAVNDLKRLDNQLLLTALKEGKNTFYYANQFSEALFSVSEKKTQFVNTP